MKSRHISKRIVASLVGTEMVWIEWGFPTAMTERTSFGRGWVVTDDGCRDSDLGMRAVVESVLQLTPKAKAGRGNLVTDYAGCNKRRMNFKRRHS
ncbi:hypothetical protein AVEN_171375-1 [Araneus ventricosus]|uniref:Uncharacterized protein n=1 Tax=Araneus ventricosus TaxID=182803 RepID=A0A4Y2FI81_ARAVE|nr:hypothetical protein AVEN_171375-1 [Araneus ventricosus]